jgi:hypothetical protein
VIDNLERAITERYALGEVMADNDGVAGLEVDISPSLVESPAAAEVQIRI